MANKETSKHPSGDAEGVDESSSKTRSKKRIDWDDPNVPVGNAPPMPRWPIIIATLAWIGWLGFLFAMAASRAPTVPA